MSRHGRIEITFAGSRSDSGLRFVAVEATGEFMNNQVNEFSEYNERFNRLVGEIQTGQYGRYRGRVVRRMNAEEFNLKTASYGELGQRFNRILDTGDTIDEGLTVDLRSIETELILEQSRYLP
jgi:hypothetical protein